MPTCRISVMPHAETQHGPSRRPSLPTPSPSKVRQPSASKAAFLCVKESLSEQLESRDELEAALQHAGYNPTRRMLDRLWVEGRPIDFAAFAAICQSEPVPKINEIIALFK